MAQGLPFSPVSCMSIQRYRHSFGCVGCMLRGLSTIGRAHRIVHTTILPLVQPWYLQRCRFASVPRKVELDMTEPDFIKKEGKPEASGRRKQPEKSETHWFMSLILGSIAFIETTWIVLIQLIMGILIVYTLGLDEKFAALTAWKAKKQEIHSMDEETICEDGVYYHRLVRAQAPSPAETLNQQIAQQSARLQSLSTEMQQGARGSQAGSQAH
eukprot:g42181.t1